MTILRVLGALTLAVPAAPIASEPAAAQSRPHAWLALQGSSVKADSKFPGGGERVSGSAVGGEGGVWWKLVSLRVGYLNGALRPDIEGPAHRDYIQGWVFLGVRPVQGLEISGGPHARAYVRELPTPGPGPGPGDDEDAPLQTRATQRWLTWELHGRYEGMFVPDLLGGYGELWTAVAGSVNDAGEFDRGRGAAAGVVLYLARGQVGIRLGYALDETRLGNGAWRETVEGFTISVGYGRR